MQIEGGVKYIALRPWILSETNERSDFASDGEKGWHIDEKYEVVGEG